MTRTVLTNIRCADSSATSLLIVDGRVTAHDVAPQPGDIVVEGNGRLALPAMAEAHAHLDKAFLSETIANPTGDLMGAIEAMERHRGDLTVVDTIARAERAALVMLQNGTTALRTHADVSTWNGLTSVEALLEVRRRLADRVDIEVVALTGWPTTGAEGADNRALLREAIAMGVDGVGGCPHLEPQPFAATDGFLEMAVDTGCWVDLHTDETLNPERFTLEHLADVVLATGFTQRVAASHCVSLGMQSTDVQQRTAEKVAAANISVVALPSTNLFLQGRDHQQAMPRGLTAVAALRTAGASLVAGYDNLQDPFNPVGRGDCLETASLMISAAHLLPADAYLAVSNGVRTMMGRSAAGTGIGSTADLVLLPAATTREAIAFAPAGRTVLRNGVVVAG